MVFLQDALSQLRGVSSCGGRSSEPLETLQSRARELEKKVCCNENRVFIIRWKPLVCNCCCFLCMYSCVTFIYDKSTV